MADQECLKKKRTSAKAKFTRTISSLEQLLITKCANTDEITRAFDDFCNAWTRLEERHDDYVESLDDDGSSEYTWICTEHKRYDTLRHEYYGYLTDYENLRKLEASKKLRHIKNNTFNDHCSLIEAAIIGENSMEIILRQKSILEHKYYTFIGLG